MFYLALLDAYLLICLSEIFFWVELYRLIFVAKNLGASTVSLSMI